MNGDLIIWWLLLAAISCFVGFQDITKRVISNRSCIIVFIVCNIIAVRTGNYQVFLYVAIIFITGFILFLFNIIAAGDIKLAAAFSIAVNPKYQLLVITIILLLGGIIALGQLAWKKYKTNEKIDGVPYGVPICIGYLFGIAASI